MNQTVNSVREWIDATEQFHIRLSNFVPGKFIDHITHNSTVAGKESIRFMCCDPNIEDFTNYPQYNPPNTYLNPTTFFKDVYYLEWTQNGCNIPLCGLGKFFSDDFIKPLNLHLEVSKNNWCPIDNGGYVFSVSHSEENEILESKRHWTEFPKTTKVGWRGPMILSTHLNKMPLLMYNNEESK